MCLGNMSNRAYVGANKINSFRGQLDPETFNPESDRPPLEL